MNRIITIGREFGSGGRELGRRLADALQFAYYDREIVTELARRTSLSEEYVQRIVEHRPTVAFPIHVGRSFYPMVNPMWEQGQAVYQEQHRLIKEMAAASSCVIVGRCADYILRDMRPFRIFVYADMASKMRRCRENGEDAKAMSDKELTQHINDINKGRAKYYEFYSGQEWGGRLNYDLCVNTTQLDLGEVVAAIAKLF
ncbi:cytidylate kinase-like family protein [uncultured Fretibacterium sp.]|uniref:cytidylate kinase-like family protein n=1 Tax=uncultured Fretibacterium sp. TaxID=1678694 RepID=UPI00260325A5|nr:cytidylate kinase-like family protein [uncultured Fretibacterium sp.]